MNKTSFGDIHATGGDRSPSSGESNVVGQPPITPGTGLLGADWLTGPSNGTQPEASELRLYVAVVVAVMAGYGRPVARAAPLG